ncbi:fibrillarin-like rRNA/tRNA 2'-O-methyltransferase [Candidatus Micrarchaeota archaeon]|nr:fibrillarin-like rRNA/tRNA 2'-O-methyltransferase [Candidatus Micrarchaeota archaeon]
MVSGSQSSFYGTVQIKGSFATRNADKGRRVYGERLVKTDDFEYRLWDPHRSKLCGAMKKGLKTFPFKYGSKILYLGASTGTTISHLSDIIGDEGELYAVEIAPQCMKSLISLSERRNNIIPIHADARHPEEYVDVGKVEIIYMDVAQPDQDEILIKNAKEFLQKDGIAFFCVKSQSIDVTKEPQVVFDQVIKKLEPHFEVLEKIKLEPFDKDHLFLALRFLA